MRLAQVCKQLNKHITGTDRYKHLSGMRKHCASFSLAKDVPTEKVPIKKRRTPAEQLFGAGGGDPRTVVLYLPMLKVLSSV